MGELNQKKSLDIYEDTPYFPAFVGFEVTRQCNLQCIHCGSSATNRPRERELTIDEWKNVTDQLVALDTRHVTFLGGEPLIWPHWRELCQHIHQYHWQISMVSNGYKVVEDDIRFFKDMGAANLGFSLDGLPKTHNYIRQREDSFQRVEKAVGYLKKVGLTASIVTAVNKLNFNDLRPLYKHLVSLGVDTWQLQPVNTFGRAGENKTELLMDRSQLVELIDFIHEAQRDSNKTIVGPGDSVGYCFGKAAEIWGDQEWSGCNAGLYVMGVQSNGDVLGCCSMQTDAYPPAGNVLKQPIAEIWKNDEAFAYNRKFSLESLKGPCKGCQYGEKCRSGCLSMGYATSGEIHNNPYCYYAIQKNL